MALGKTDIVGSVYVYGEGEVSIPDGYKVVKYGAIRKGDYERIAGEWVEVNEKKIGKKAVSTTIMREI